jgi:ABC-2 type transport system permease protein
MPALTRMAGAIARFEIGYHLRQPLIYLTSALFAVLTFAAVSSDAVTIGGAIGNVHRNAPFVILNLLGAMSLIGMFVVTAFMASAAQRDFELGTAPLFFSKPIRKMDYLAGRFAGSLLISLGVFVGAAAGILLGSLMPWLEPERLGPTQLGPYLFALLVLVLPNLLFVGAVFFTLAGLSRSLLATYMGVVGLFVLWIVSQVLLSDVENLFAASLVDPFGLASLALDTRYWTVTEKNAILPALGMGGGSLLLNRLIWSAVGLAIFFAGALAFDPTRQSRARRRKEKLLAAEAAKTAAPASFPFSTAISKAVPRARRSFTAADHVQQFLHQAGLESSWVLRGLLFSVLLAFGITNVQASLAFGIERFGTSIYPVTPEMLDALRGSFNFLLIIIVVFYSGEILGKERAVKLHEVYDALPVPTWVPLAAKLAAMVMVVVAFLATGGLAAAAFQLFQGYFDLEPALYAQGLFLESLPFLLIAVLSVFLHVVAHNKFVGYLLMILYLISSIVLSALDFDHNLYRYAGGPQMTVSAFNGYGPYLQGLFWFALYWSFGALVLFALALLFRVRGTDPSWRTRLRQARERFHGPVRWMLAAGVVGFLATGAFVFYNTNVRNPYVPGDLAEQHQADYETKYRRYKDIAMPRVTAVRTWVDIFPAERRMTARGRYLLANKTGKPLADIHVSLDPRVEVRKLDFGGHTVKLHDKELGYSIYHLNRPLAPGEVRPFEFEVAAGVHGFPNDGAGDLSLVENGTFFNNRQYFPAFGYDQSRQLLDRNDRRKHDLPPVIRMAKVDDLSARRNTYLSNDSDWIDFATTVSTSADQIALAPGYLQRTWEKDGRRYFEYKMDAPILHFYSYLSARWAVRKDRWKNVAIEVYHHPAHGWNVDRMIDGVKKSLDYFTANFGPYQHRQVRILEFPRYATFAQSFPNTIPYSEGIGFIANLEDEDAIDYPFYVTAHEVAHQWWAHQVIGGDVQGSTLMSETLSQYSALMVMEREYGRDKMRRFLQYELDNYLSSRSGELVEEMPLLLVENQGYIHYRKGSLVMYALKEAIGEAAVNRALSRYLHAVQYQQPPYTNSLEFISYIEAETPPNLRPLLDDLFRRITLYENKVQEASYAKRPDGRYDVALTVNAKKLNADGQGKETEVKLDDWVEIGVFGEKPVAGRKKPEETVLYLQKVRMTAPRATFRMTVDAVPVRAGIDPYNKLVDRNSEDNRKPVSAGAIAAAAAGPA